MQSLGGQKKISHLAKEFEIFLLGPSMVGKSSLIRALQGLTITNPDEHTDSADADVFTLELDLANAKWQPARHTEPVSVSTIPIPTLEETVVVSIWDLAGEPRYHLSMRLFLSSNSLFVIVLDPNEKWEEDLQYYRAFANDHQASDKNIFVVFTKLDTLSTEQVALLTSAYTNSPARLPEHQSFFVSSRSGDKLNDLNKAIIGHAKHLLASRQQCALSSWEFLLLAGVLEHGPILEVDQVHSIVKEPVLQTISDSSLLAALDRFRQLGHLLYYPEQKLIVTRPSWLLSLLKVLFSLPSDPPGLIGKSELLSSDEPFLIPQRHLTYEIHAKLLNLFERFYIMIPLAQYYILPQLSRQMYGNAPPQITSLSATSVSITSANVGVYFAVLASMLRILPSPSIAFSALTCYLQSGDSQILLRNFDTRVRLTIHNPLPLIAQEYLSALSTALHSASFPCQISSTICSWR